MRPDPDQLVLLTSTRTEFEGRTMAASLEAEGIPTRVFAASAQMLQWEGGITSTVRVMVRRADLDRAALVLRQVRRDSVDLDWSEVDVGQPEDDTARDITGTSPRIGGFSPRLSAVRSLGFTLIFALMLLNWLGPQNAIAALVIAGLFVASILPKPRRRNSGIHSGHR